MRITLIAICLTFSTFVAIASARSTVQIDPGTSTIVPAGNLVDVEVRCVARDHGRQHFCFCRHYGEESHLIRKDQFGETRVNVYWGVNAGIWCLDGITQFPTCAR